MLRLLLLGFLLDDFFDFFVSLDFTEVSSWFCSDLFSPLSVVSISKEESFLFSLACCPVAASVLLLLSSLEEEEEERGGERVMAAALDGKRA